tara:strand:- start:146 stop:355 length:210 start_codon:yes stop_codon:yes gene_type:complete
MGLNWLIGKYQKYMTFLRKYKPYNEGLKTTTNTTTISKIVGTSFIILKNLDDFLFEFIAKSLRYLPSKK